MIEPWSMRNDDRPAGDFNFDPLGLAPDRYVEGGVGFPSADSRLMKVMQTRELNNGRKLMPTGAKPTGDPRYILTNRQPRDCL